MSWLEDQGELTWLDNFYRALEEIKSLLSRYPEAGAQIEASERSVLRVLSFPRRLPYLVYYRHDRRRPIHELQFVRLFHHAQKRPEPGLGDRAP